MDKAKKQYWDQIWESSDMPQAVNPKDRGLSNYVNRRFHEYFCQIFSNMDTQGRKVLEIGCARSIWLPYFAKEFKFKVYGIDYSEAGCEQAIQSLANEGVAGEIVCADFFSPPQSMMGVFDVAISFGVVEHFQNPDKCIAAFSKFLKPGGLLFTNIPNLCGLNGFIQKMINRPIYDIHLPLDKESLIRSHQINGLKIISCDYFIFINLGVLNIENLKSNMIYIGADRIRTLINKLAWIFERMLPVLKPNRWSSPYINCLSTKVINVDEI